MINTNTNTTTKGQFSVQQSYDCEMVRCVHRSFMGHACDACAAATPQIVRVPDYVQGVIVHFWIEEPQRRSGFTSERVTLRVPVLFFDDHEARGLVTYSGESHDYTIKRGTRWITVSLHPLDVAELRSDAEYYADFDGYDFQDNRQIVGSARNTLKALVLHD